MIATAQVARQKKRAKGGPDRMPLGHGEDALAPITQTLNSNEAGRRDACPTAVARAWSPDANDHLVYHWVKFGGKTQELAAQLLGISQPTVSRIIDRYERWQAHAKEREGGRLDPAERLRAQRWLTYERNELILASALRIAGEMEGFTELTKSVVNRPVSQFTKESEIRSESATIDRHGIAARFLRLAFRINMEQLKLVSRDAPPLPTPLSAEELDEHAANAEAICAEFAAVERARAEEAAREVERVAEEQRLAAECLAAERLDAEQLNLERLNVEQLAADMPSETRAAEEIIQPVNKLNNRRPTESGANRAADSTCAADREREVFVQPQCRPPTPSGLTAWETIHHDPPGATTEGLSIASPQGTAGPTFAPAVP